MSKTKITVIPIDLGYDVQDLINEGVEELTGEAKQELETAIAVAKERDALREKQNTEKNKAQDAVTAIMEQVYEQIAGAGENGVLCSDIMNSVSDHIPNSSAFTLRMKKLLRDKGNPYTITRKKVQGNPHYVFIAYNQ